MSSVTLAGFFDIFDAGRMENTEKFQDEKIGTEMDFRGKNRWYSFVFSTIVQYSSDELTKWPVKCSFKSRSLQSQLSKTYVSLNCSLYKLGKRDILKRFTANKAEKSLPQIATKN